MIERKKLSYGDMGIKLSPRYQLTEGNEKNILKKISFELS